MKTKTLKFIKGGYHQKYDVMITVPTGLKWVKNDVVGRGGKYEDHVNYWTVVTNYDNEKLEKKLGNSTVLSTIKLGEKTTILSIHDVKEHPELEETSWEELLSQEPLKDLVFLEMNDYGNIISVSRIIGLEDPESSNFQQISLVGIDGVTKTNNINTYNYTELPEAYRKNIGIWINGEEARDLWQYVLQESVKPYSLEKVPTKNYKLYSRSEEYNWDKDNIIEVVKKLSEIRNQFKFND